MATRVRNRIFALVLAILFFAVSFSLSFLVIWQLYKDHKEAKNVNTASNTTTKADDTAKDQPASQSKLEGTALGNFTPTSSVDDLQIADLVPGDGQEVKSGDKVTVDYTGAVAATGIIFQSSLDRGQPVTFSLDGVIQGWQEGIPGMKIGGTRRLLIPAEKAYGANPPEGSNIPANAPLVFDVTLKSIGG